MGMYTELCIGVEFKEDTPKQIIQILSYMTSTEEGQVRMDVQIPNHPLFQTTDRWSWMLQSGGSYYFDAKPQLTWKFDKISRTWFLTVWTNIKNYGSEWQKFLDFISPYLDTEGFIGHYRYEEDENPTLLYNEGGKILWKSIQGGTLVEWKE